MRLQKIPVTIVHNDIEKQKYLFDLIEDNPRLTVRSNQRSLETYMSDPQKHQDRILFVESSQALYFNGKIGNSELNVVQIENEVSPEIKAEQARLLVQRILHSVSLGNLHKTLDYEPHGFNTGHTSIKISRIVNELIEEDKLSHKLSVGIVGAGELGISIVKELIEHEWLSNVNVWSEYFSSKTKGNNPLDLLCGTAYGGGKISKENSLESLLDRNPDVLLITTGPHKANYNITREEFVTRNLLPSWNKVSKILEEIANQDYQGLICIETHPPGIFLTLANTRYGITSRRLTSISSDSMRMQNQIWMELVRKNPSLAEKINKKDIPLDVWGEHGSGIIPIIGPEFYEKIEITSEEWNKYEERFTKEVRKIGQEIMTVAKKTGINYIDTPRAIVQVLERIAHYKSDTGFSLYSEVGERTLQAIEYTGKSENAFLLLPTAFTYTPLGIRRNGSIVMKEIPDKIKAELRTQIENQYKMRLLIEKSH